MNKSVTIYSTQTCHYCNLAKQFFADNNIEYTTIDVGADREKAKEMVQKTGQMGVPVIEIDGETVVGFDEEKLRTMLGL